MAEEPRPEVTPPRKSILPRLLVLALVMLLVAAAVNFKDLRAIAAGEKTVTSVLYGKNLSPVGPAFAFPAPLGPEDAKVKALVVCQEGNSCHEPLVILWMAVAKLEPERLRVDFGGASHGAPAGAPAPKDAPTPAKGAAEKAETPPEIGCESGVTLNGQLKFELGTGKAKRVIYLTGPTPAPPAAPGTEPPPPSTPGAGHGWTTDDVIAIVNQQIEKAYKAKGKLTAAALQTAMTEASKEIPRPEATKDGQPAHH